ncbi:MAG: hypothetical protein ACJ8EL_15330 [Rhizomicrobium sp.]
MKISYVAVLALAALSASRAYAGDPLIDLDVSIGASHTATDLGGGFTVTGLKAAKYNVLLTGNPVKSYLDGDGGQHISLQINGKRLPVTCSQTGCVAKGVALKGSVSGKVALAN